MRKWAILSGVLVLLGVIQLVSASRPFDNPPVIREPRWDSADTRDLARAACFDCHSNETRWPAYASIAPASWLIRHDVASGRMKLNFSEWQRGQKHADDAADVVRKSEMPLWFYTPLHPAARLSAPDRERLAAGLERTISASPPGRPEAPAR